MSKQISVAQYAEIRKITPQAVHQNIKKGYALPGVTKVDKIGNHYILTVDDTIVNQEPASVEEDWL